MEQFKEMVKCHMEQHFGGEYQVSVHKVRKNNGVCRIGLNIRKEGETVVPTIYLDFYLEEFRNGRDLGEIYLDMISVYEKHKNDIMFDSKALSEFETAKDNICLRLVNLEKNREMLEELPYTVFHDLAVAFYVYLPEIGENSSAAITKRIMEAWKTDLDVEDLYSLALHNTRRIFGEEIISLEELMAEMIKKVPEKVMDIPELAEEKELSMYVATSKTRINGAAVILYPDFLKKFTDRIGGDFYILPSSIHETIFVPKDGENQPQKLATMVKEVNEEQVLPEEVLSDSVYLYNRQNDSITICSQ